MTSGDVIAEPPTSPDEAPGTFPPQAGEAVRITGLEHAYGETATLGGIDLSVRSGEVLGIVGPSGCGKSTLLELLCGLVEPVAGTLEICGETGSGARLGSCAYMPQRDLLLPWYSALDNAALGPRNAGLDRAGARSLASALFSRFGLGGFEDARPSELSGGMRQRVAFLRTLVAGKPVLLLDEPFASLDAITRADLQEWLAGALAAERRTAVLVTHDIEEALYLCDSVTVLSRRPGRVTGTLSAPRPRMTDRDAAVTDPAFVSARERAMQMLREGAR